MKNIIITVIIIFSAFNLSAQTGGVEVYAKSNCSQSSNNKFVIDIFIQSEDAAEDIYIAEQNYRFDYNDMALANPTLLTTGSDLNFGNPIISGGNVILYSDAGFFLFNNDVSISTDLLSTSGLNLSNTTPIYICSVQFDVLNAGLPINFNWHDPTEFPPTYLSSNNGTTSSIEVRAIFYDNLQPTVQDHFDSAVSANDFNRDWMHVCTTNDGSLEVSWDSNVYNEIYISIDGGNTFTATTGDSFSITNLGVGDYDIRVKEGENGCAITLEDINIQDLSHQVTRTWGNPTCGENNGWIELTWVKKALNNIDISIDGGVTYERVSAALEVYRFEGLTTGDYDVRVKWAYAPYACPTILDDVNLGVSKPGANGLRADYYCANDRLRLSEVNITADNYQFRYRTLSGGTWSLWKNSALTTNGIRNIYNLPNVTWAQVRLRVHCGGKWSVWSAPKKFNFPIQCKLGVATVSPVNIHPNPANQQVTIDLNGQEFETGTVTIFDLAGKEAQVNSLSANQSAARLNTSHLTNGIYLIKINTDGQEIHTQKLTIAH